ncbi:unnamed protein product [Chrysodeixis includens]|uniref:Uncharacterized protein n=1 Tax=Chrysodeixis includens TaxID=689277 RepID=A0A9N8KR77_CHRIL|nr:unnamed protein product [Chrysodeixis includens]
MDSNGETGPDPVPVLSLPEKEPEKEPPTPAPTDTETTNEPIPVVLKPIVKSVPIMGLGIKPVMRKRRNKEVTTRDVGTSTPMLQAPQAVKRRNIKDEPCYRLLTGKPAS